MRKKNNNQSLKQLPFKKRGARKAKKLKLVFGSLGLFSSQQQRLEGLYVKKLKLKFKKSIRKRKKQHRPITTKRTIWIRYKLNTYFTKKSKNARMGSGKGKPCRKAFTAAPQTTLLELRHSTPFLLRRLQNHIKRKWAIRTIPLISATNT